MFSFIRILRAGALPLMSLLLLAACDQDRSEEQNSAEIRNESEPVMDQRSALMAGDFSSCTVCHGADLKGNEATAAPSLARLPTWYVKDQLIAFRNGWRGSDPADATGASMHRTALLMEDRMIEAAVEYVGGYAAPIAQGFSLTPEDGEAALLYQRVCSTCHGDTGLGDAQTHAPPLVGISKWYLQIQLYKFKSGARGAHADDVWGATMASAIELLSENDIDLILDILARP